VRANAEVSGAHSRRPQAQTALGVRLDCLVGTRHNEGSSPKLHMISTAGP
jgi:hypothetical protein